MNNMLLGVLAGFMLCWALLVVCIRRSYAQRMRDEQLNAPLLGDSNEHRLDAAIRGAEEGHKECGVCGFENFKRFFFCNICGEKLRNSNANKRKNNNSNSTDGNNNAKLATTMTTERSRSKGASEYRSESSLQLVECSASSEMAAVALRAPFTQRQRRARKRKEWIRKLGVNGELFWCREGSCGADLRFPGYTLEYQGEQEITVTGQESVVDGQHEEQPPVELEPITIVVDAVNPEGTINGIPEPNTNQVVPSLAVTEPESDGQDNGDADDEQTTSTTADEQATQLAKENCTKALSDAVSTLSVHLLDASSADASKLALGSSTSNEPKLQWRDILNHATQVFPAKYAHFVTTTAGLIQTSESVTVTIHRESLLKDSIVALASLPVANVRTTMRVHFVKEAGIDAGGLHREWFVLVNEKLVDPSVYGVFRCVNQEEQTFYLNPNSRHDVGEHHLMYYYATGRLIGRALLEGYVLGFHLALPLLKIVLGLPVAFSDLEYFDPEMYKNMVWIMENDDVGSLGLDFSITEKRGDEMVVVDLIPNGRNIDVTDDNKDEYLKRRFRYLIYESVSSQLYVFLKGLYEVIPQELLMLFDAEEFDYLLCGSDEIDVDDWQRNTRSTIGLRGHPVSNWFWEIVREMPNEYRRRLLHFATGSSRVPIAGFSSLTSYDGRLCPFTLKGVRLVKDGYIWSHACFNRLDLPLHKDRAQLKAVMYATLETEMYGFTTH